MNTRGEIATCLLALAGLLYGPASQATGVAELPLKASVLAKPNVIFGLDDSGSMDGEMLLHTNDGMFWWDYSAAAGWNSSGTPWFNEVGDATTQFRKMIYLFPNGTATGARTYADATNDHFAVPPTTQFAWLRSSAYNPIYYDSRTTYSPWSPAYVSGTTVTYTAASTSAAKSHPIYGTDTLNLTTDVAANRTANFTFTAFPGMKVPIGADTCDYASCTTWTGTATEFTVASGTIKKVSYAYYPATFWTKESCTVSTDAKDSDRTCAYAPDGTTTLKRYQIKSGNSFPSGRSYADEIQNFANWFQYHRKRKLMLNGAVGQVLEPLTGLRMGMVVFNSRSTVTMYDIDSTNPATNGRKVAGLFYATNGSGGTPTRETLQYIGEQYRNNSTVIQYACQRNAAFIMTDGFATVSSTTAPFSYDQATWGSGAPYQTIYSPSLADLALAYYTVNLNTTFVKGQVPTTSADTNKNLHMNTYGMTLGAKGTIFVNEDTPVPTAASAWPNPTSNRSPTAVDDLWHATINGRGKMYTAATPAETAERIRTGLLDFLNQNGAQAGVAVSTVNLSRGDGNAYLGAYNPSGWTGDLTANAIDSASGNISTTATWSASAKLTARDWTTRVIASHNGSGGAAFTEAGVGSIVAASGSWGTTADVMNYLRGDRSKEGTTFRARSSLMGAIISSEPAIDRDNKVAYIASGEGMLHAFDVTPGSTAGQELWAFVPNAVLADMGQTTARGYTFKTQLDGTPVIGKTGASSKLLVAGMGAAGRNYYALDVSAPRSRSESDLSWVKWQFPTGSADSYATKVGQTLGRPSIVNTAAGYRVLVTSGYNSTYDGKGRLFVLDPATGSVLKEFQTPAGSLGAESGLAGVSGYLEDDNTVRYAYGGDLLGNLWRFDLDAASGTDATLVAVLKGPTGATQPVTAAPELAFIGGKRVVFVGTGRLLDVTDFGNSAVQTFYAIADGATLSNARSSLISRTYNRATDTVSGAVVDWTTSRGWYLDLAAGEQANTRPSVGYGSVAFNTNVTGASDCTASSYYYLLDFTTGLKSDSADQVSSTLSTKANVSGVNAVLTSDGKVRGLMQTTDGDPLSRDMAKRPTITPNKNSWREIRQD